MYDVQNVISQENYDGVLIVSSHVQGSDNKAAFINHLC
jgi:hypothetical protein